MIKRGQTGIEHELGCRIFISFNTFLEYASFIQNVHQRRVIVLHWGQYLEFIQWVKIPPMFPVGTSVWHPNFHICPSATVHSACHSCRRWTPNSRHQRSQNKFHYKPGRPVVVQVWLIAIHRKPFPMFAFCKYLHVLQKHVLHSTSPAKDWVDSYRNNSPWIIVDSALKLEKKTLNDYCHMKHQSMQSVLPVINYHKHNWNATIFDFKLISLSTVMMLPRAAWNTMEWLLMIDWHSDANSKAPGTRQW